MEVEPNSVVQAGAMISGVAAKHATGTAIAVAGGTTLVTAVVMAATMPKRKADFFLCIISTVISSLSLGSYAVVHFDLIGDLLLAPTIEQAYMILAQIGGMFFISGLPGWVVLRSFFVWSESHRKSTLPQIISEARGIWQK